MPSFVTAADSETDMAWPEFTLYTHQFYITDNRSRISSREKGEKRKSDRKEEAALLPTLTLPPQTIMALGFGGWK